MSSKSNAGERFITDSFVQDVLNGTHEMSQDRELMEELGTEDLEYVLGGGMAVQSYLMEGYSERVQEGDIDPSEIALEDVLRGTEDIDLGFYSENVDPDTEIFMKQLTNPERGYFSGDVTEREERSYFGKASQRGNPDESVILNASGKLKGASDQAYREMIENKNLYSVGDTEFFRLRVEDLIVSKLDGYLNNQGRGKDLEDARNLLYFQQDNIDEQYMSNRMSQFERGGEMAQALEEVQQQRGIHTYQ